MLTGLLVVPLTVILLAADAPAAASAPADAAPATGFLYKSIEIDGEKYAYCVFVTPSYRPDRATPCILFLHGSGERGNDGFKQTDVGIGRALRRAHSRFPGIVVMPQCRSEDVWWSPKMTQMVSRIMQATNAEYNLDHDRVYLTGLSLGGGGCWHFATAMPNAFAAVAPICAISDARIGRPGLAPRLKDVPLWVFHGGADQAVPVADSQEMVRAIREAGGNVQYTEYPGAGHTIWDRVYDDMDFWRWLRAQSRGAPPAAPTTPPSGSE